MLARHGVRLEAAKGTWRDFGYIVPRAADQRALDGWDPAFERRIVADVDTLESGLACCEAGLGVAFAPDVAIAGRVARGSLAVVAEAPAAFEEQVYAVWRKGLRLRPAVRQLLELF